MAVKVEIQRWTPTRAKEALTENKVNRNIRPSKVTVFARDMREGRWTFCPDPITFNSRGELINGQHRLTAQIESGKTINWVVCVNVPEDTQKTMDTGSMRSLTDLLTMEGSANVRTLGAVARLALKMDTGRIFFQTRDSLASNTELMEFIENNPSLKHSAAMGRFAAKGGILKTRESALGAAHWWIAKYVSVAEADAFLHRMGTLVGEKDGSPVIALVKRLNEISRNSIRIDSRWIIYMVLKCWNYEATGTEVRRLHTSTRDGEYKLLIPLKRGAKLSQDDLSDDLDD